MKYLPPTRLIRHLRLVTGGLFILFILLLLGRVILQQHAPETPEEEPLSPINGILKTSFAGDILTLDPASPQATAPAPWDDFGDAIARLASEALLPLLHPTGTTFFIAPRPNTLAPLDLPCIDPLTPQPCDGVWIECPSVFDTREAALFQDACLAQWAQALAPHGRFICDLDARGREPATLQAHLKKLTNHFAFVALSATGLQRWQLIAAHAPLRLCPEAIEARFLQPDLRLPLEQNAITSPWPLFAALLSSDTTALLQAPLSTQKGALGLIETFAPLMNTDLAWFTTSAPIATFRAERQAFYCGHRTPFARPSQDPLILSLVTIDYALAQTYLTHRNEREALNCCKTAQTRAVPSVEQTLFTLDLALLCKDTPTIEAMLETLATLPPTHPAYLQALAARYQTLLTLRDPQRLLSFLEPLHYNTALPQHLRTFYTLETLFLRAETAPTRPHLLALHTALAPLSEGERAPYLQRYSALLNTHCTPQLTLQFLASLSTHNTWPPFETLFPKE